jgi:hypothetical protein
MVKPVRGLWKVKWFPKKASTTFLKGELVDLVSGSVQPSTSSTVSTLGINQDSAYASSDATTVKIPVLVAKSRGAELESDTTAVVTVGSEYDLSDSQTIDAAASSNDTVTAIKVITTTRAVFALNKAQLA